MRRNADIFVWSTKDMIGIDPEMAMHHLNVDPRIRYVKQKMRYFGPVKDKIIQKEVQKLLEVGQVREI